MHQNQNELFSQTLLVDIISSDYISLYQIISDYISSDIIFFMYV